MASPFLLVQLSDPHVGATWGGPDPVGRLAAAVEAVRRLDARPGAVVVTGDLAEHGADAEYGLAHEALERLDVPVHVLPGNHDDRAALRRGFGLPSETAAVRYAADVGPLRLVCVDSTRPGEDGGELDAAELGWLDETLGAEPTRPTLLAMHHPPITTGTPAWDGIGIPAADRLALGAVLGRHPQVLGVAAGHLHRAIVAAIAGRAVVVAPSTYVQARLDLGATAIALGPDPPGFVVHALVDGELTSHVQPVA
jgi:3',5'-cyclic AMP phosphodiesterase CpdA